MKEKSATARPKTPVLRVGDRVWVKLIGQRRVAEIIEDRGPIGVGGRRLMRIGFRNPSGQFEESFEVPAEYLSVKSSAGKSKLSRPVKRPKRAGASA